MSEINKALSQLATKHHATLEHIQAADVPAVTKRPRLDLGDWRFRPQFGRRWLGCFAAGVRRGRADSNLYQRTGYSGVGIAAVADTKNTHQPGEYLPRGQRGGHTADS